LDPVKPTTKFQTYLSVSPTKKGELINTGINGNRSVIKSFTVNDEYGIRLKYKKKSLDEKEPYASSI
jgi:hypothetical protein